jgi:hypothetical protein
MCYKTPKAPAAQPAPQRKDVQGDVTAQRKRLADQSGITGNIFTSALGDVGYGKSAVAQNKLATLNPA